MESLDAMPEGVQLVQDLSSTPPGKFLKLGVDALITIMNQSKVFTPSLNTGSRWE